MKKLIMVATLSLSCVLTMPVAALAADIEVRKPSLDKEGRFWVYRNADAPMPFVPYGWMPEEAARMMKLDVACEKEPYVPNGKPAAGETCISVAVTWAAPNWCGVAFLSGPDAPPWWGEDERGWSYDLSGLKNRRLVFYARSDQQARIQVKVGILGDKPFGDSLPFPSQTRWLKLTKDWKRYELALPANPALLKRIANGVTLVLNRDQQDDSSGQTQFAIDSIFFE